MGVVERLADCGCLVSAFLASWLCCGAGGLVLGCRSDGDGGSAQSRRCRYHVSEAVGGLAADDLAGVGFTYVCTGFNGEEYLRARFELELPRIPVYDTFDDVITSTEELLAQTITLINREVSRP